MTEPQRDEQSAHVVVPTPLNAGGLLLKLIIDRGDQVWVLGKPSQMPDFGVRVSNEDYFGYCVFSVPEQVCEFVNGKRFRPKGA